jgi:hypothetical protein
LILLLGKLKDKKDLFIGTNEKKFPYSKLEYVDGNPFVITIAPFDSDYDYTQNNRVLFDIDYRNITKEISAVIFSNIGTF